jgi:hypothetical protein
LLPAGTAPGSGDDEVERSTLPELAGAPVALAGLDPSDPDDLEGTVDAPGLVYLANGGGDRWSMDVDGEDVPREDAYGWASTFTVEQAGPGRLTFDTPPTRWLALLGQVVLWVLAIGYLLRVRVVEDERDALPVEAPVAPAHVVVDPRWSPERTAEAAPSTPEEPIIPDAPTTMIPAVSRTAAPETSPSGEEPGIGDSSDLPTTATPAVTVEGPPAKRRGRRGRGKYAR